MCPAINVDPGEGDGARDVGLRLGEMEGGTRGTGGVQDVRVEGTGSERATI